MLSGIEELTGVSIKALDGLVGKTKGFLLEDHRWSIRHLIAETGNWPVVENKLLDKGEFGFLDKRICRNSFPVGLLRAQAETSESRDVSTPSSKPVEVKYSRLQPHSVYRTNPNGHGSVSTMARNVSPGVAPGLNPRLPEETRNRKTVQCQFVTESGVLSSTINASNDSFGTVGDLLPDDVTWQWAYLIRRCGQVFSEQEILPQCQASGILRSRNSGRFTGVLR